MSEATATRATSRNIVANPTALEYVPALDGLRGIAVAAVVLFHFDVPWAQGGFLGVDIFFVLSGALITLVLCAEFERTGGISLRRFWENRIRRLLPPLVVMGASVLLVEMIIGSAETRTSALGDLRASLLYYANWHFIAEQQDYFTDYLAPSNFQHTWSLAIEEQWYVVWPIVLTVIFKLATRRRISLLAIGTSAAVVLSAAWMFVLHDGQNASRAYFDTGARAQHLLLGALVAFAVARNRAHPVSLFWLRGVVARSETQFVLATIIVVFMFMTRENSSYLYAGGFTGFSVLVAVFLYQIMTTDSEFSSRRSIASLISTPVLVWIGKRSYAIYLWHWPVLQLGKRVVDGRGIVFYLVAGCLTIFLAAVSYSTIERVEIRRSQRRRVDPKLWAGLTLGLLLISGFLSLRSPATSDLKSGDDRFFEPEQQPIAPADSTPSATRERPVSSVLKPSGPADEPSGPPDETVPADEAAPVAASDDRRSLLVLGDSTALTLLVEQGETLKDTWRLYGHASLGCSVTAGRTIDAGSTTPNGGGTDCEDRRLDWSNAIDAANPSVSLLVLGTWEMLDHVVDGDYIRFPSPAWTDFVTTSIVEAVDDVSVRTAGPVLLLAVPCMDQQRNESGGALARNDVVRQQAINGILADVAAQSARTRVIDHSAVVCDGAGEPLLGDQIRYDGVHYTPLGAGRFWTWLGQELVGI